MFCACITKKRKKTPQKKEKGVLPLLGSVLGQARVQRGVIGRRIDPLAQRFKQFPRIFRAIRATRHRHNKRAQFPPNLRSLRPNFPAINVGSFDKSKKSQSDPQTEEGRRTRTGTHLLHEQPEHFPAIRHVAAKARAARVRVLARGELLGPRKVDAVIAHREPRAVEAGRGPATDVHHDAVRVAVRAVHDVVLVKEAQALQQIKVVARHYHRSISRVPGAGMKNERRAGGCVCVSIPPAGIRET